MRTILTDLLGTGPDGKAKYSNQAKYNELVRLGLGDYTKFDSNGTLIERSKYSSDDEYYSAMA